MQVTAGEISLLFQVPKTHRPCVVLFKPDIVATIIDIQEFRKMSPNLQNSQEEPILIASAGKNQPTVFSKTRCLK
jgi:hypothetical protein